MISVICTETMGEVRLRDSLKKNGEFGRERKKKKKAEWQKGGTENQSNTNNMMVLGSHCFHGSMGGVVGKDKDDALCNNF